MGFLSSGGKISGAAFKKMVTKASGNSKFVSGDVKKALGDMKAKKYLKDDAKVSKQQATKIMKSLKEQGLARKVTSNATAYVSKGFRQEEARKEMIRGQNLATRQKELSAEKQAANQKLSGKAPAAKRPVASTPLAAVTAVQSKPATATTATTLSPKPIIPLKTAPGLPSKLPPTLPSKPDDSEIDLAID